MSGKQIWAGLAKLSSGRLRGSNARPLAYEVTIIDARVVSNGSCCQIQALAKRTLEDASPVSSINCSVLLQPRSSIWDRRFKILNANPVAVQLQFSRITYIGVFQFLKLSPDPRTWPALACSNSYNCCQIQALAKRALEYANPVQSVQFSCSVLLQVASEERRQEGLGKDRCPEFCRAAS